VTEGITRVKGLPNAKVAQRSRNCRRRPCPDYGCSAYRDRVVTRTLHDLGDLKADRPVDVKVIYSQHYCTPCGMYFSADMSDLALPKVHYTHRVVAPAVRLVVEASLPYRVASGHLWRDHRVFVPFATIQNRVEAGGKNGEQYIAADWIKVLVVSVLSATSGPEKPRHRFLIGVGLVFPSLSCCPTCHTTHRAAGRQ